jgi:hypothetical protein
MITVGGLFRMTDIQLYLSIGIPVLSNAALLGMLVMYINARFDSVKTRIDGLRYEMTAKFESQKEQLLRSKAS